MTMATEEDFVAARRSDLASPSIMLASIQRKKILKIRKRNLRSKKNPVQTISIKVLIILTHNPSGQNPDDWIHRSRGDRKDAHPLAAEI